MDPTVDVKHETRLNIALAHLDLLECQLLFKDVLGFLINALATFVQMITSV